MVWIDSHYPLCSFYFVTHNLQEKIDDWLIIDEPDYQEVFHMNLVDVYFFIVEKDGRDFFVTLDNYCLFALIQDNVSNLCTIIERKTFFRFEVINCFNVHA